MRRAIAELPRTIHDLEQEFAGLSVAIPESPTKRVRSPTIALGDQLLVQPSTAELTRALARRGMIR